MTNTIEIVAFGNMKNFTITMKKVCMANPGMKVTTFMERMNNDRSFEYEVMQGCYGIHTAHDKSCIINS